MGERIQARVRTATETAQPDTQVKQESDIFLASPNPGVVQARLEVFHRFLVQSSGTGRDLMRQSMAAHVDQLIGLLDPKEGARDSNTQILAAQMLGSIGGGYAEAARTKLKALSETTTDVKLKAACAAALRELGPEPEKKAAPAALPPKPDGTGPEAPAQQPPVK